MQNEPRVDNADNGLDRWTLIRDVAVLQLKLVVDGMRDLILVPVSLIAGLVSLVRGGDRPGPEFYDLLQMGRQSERWINLFGAASRVRGPADEVPPTDANMDELVSRVESFVVAEYRKGGVTAQAKERLDGALDALHRFSKHGGPAD